MEQHQQKIKLFENIVRAHKKKVEINSQTLRFNRTLAMFENSPKSTSSSSGGVNRKNRNYVLTTAKMFTEIDGLSLKTAEEERLKREKELKKTEFQRKKSFFESESATDHSSTPTDNKSEVPKSYDMPDDFPDDDDYIDEDEESSIELPYLQEYFQDRSSCYER